MNHRYLIITFVRKPNGQIDEMVGIAKRLKNSDVQMANIVLDFKESKIVKCVIEREIVESDWTKMVQYYKKIYPVLIAQLEKEFVDPV